MAQVYFPISRDQRNTEYKYITYWLYADFFFFLNHKSFFYIYMTILKNTCFLKDSAWSGAQEGLWSATNGNDHKPFWVLHIC